MITAIYVVCFVCLAISLWSIFTADCPADYRLGAKMATIGIAGLLGLEAIDVARELVKEVGDVEIRTKVSVE